jgi:predicted enzyme related to lactoylglutathione lyase
MKKKTGRITRLWLTMIHVSDMDKALKFYHETLGMPIALNARMFNHAEVGPDEPLAKIGIHATGKKAKRKRRTGIVFDTDDIYALYERLRKQDVKFTLKPTKTPWGGIVANFLDPDNNELEVVQDPEHYKRKYAHQNSH